MSLIMQGRELLPRMQPADCQLIIKQQYVIDMMWFLGT